MTARQDPTLPPPPRPTRLRGVLLGLAILVGGLVVGGVATSAFLFDRMRDDLMHPRRMQERMTSDIDAALELDAAQQDQIHGIVRRRLERIDALRRRVIPEIEAQQDSLEAEVAAVLTPAQQERWRAFIDRMERMRPPFMRDGSGPPPGMPPGMPPGGPPDGMPGRDGPPPDGPPRGRSAPPPPPDGESGSRP